MGDSVLSNSVVSGGDVANPSRDAQWDASPNSTKANPLLPGKKDVTASEPKEWGTQRYGIPKDQPDSGLTKGNGGVGNAVMGS